MQDDATPHVGSSVKHLLSQQFGDRVISRHFPFPWPARSRDLIPMDFWLWGFMKSKVYQFHPQTVSDLKDASPPHVGSSVKHLLSQQFGDRVISCHFQFLWPPRSPDLTPMDFWLWGYVKSKVYQFHPQTVSDLKHATRIAI